MPGGCWARVVGANRVRARRLRARLAARCGGTCVPVGWRREAARYTAASAIRSASAVLLVGLLLDQPRAEQGVDALLDGGTLVVGQVDRARQLDEVAVEALLGLLVADAVLDVPQPLVDVLQGTLLDAELVRRGAALAPGLLEQRQFQFHVGELAGLHDARLLDAQDGDLVEQLARGDGYQDVLHARDPSNSSSLAVTSLTSISSMTPGSSILWCQGSCCGAQPR